MPGKRLQRLALAAALAVALPGGLYAMLPPAVGDPHDLTVRVTTDRPVYPLGTPVQITRSICNETPDLIRFHWTGSLGPYAEVLDTIGAVIAHAQPDGHDASGHTAEYDPGECRISVHLWHQSAGRFDDPLIPLGPPVPPGTYRARSQAVYNGGSLSLGGVSAPFHIGELPVPAPALGLPALLALIGSLALAALSLLRR
jgi:hypothetical protein